MPPTDDVTPAVVAAVGEIADRFFGVVEDMNGGEFPDAQQSHGRCRISPIALDPLPGTTRGQGWCDERMRREAQ
jgi:hypothetical protein